MVLIQSNCDCFWNNHAILFFGMNTVTKIWIFCQKYQKKGPFLAKKRLKKCKNIREKLNLLYFLNPQKVPPQKMTQKDTKPLWYFGPKAWKFWAFPRYFYGCFIWRVKFGVLPEIWIHLPNEASKLIFGVFPDIFIVFSNKFRVFPQYFSTHSP